jgi:phage protein D
VPFRPAQLASVREWGAPMLIVSVRAKGTQRDVPLRGEVLVYSLEYEDAAKKVDAISLSIDNYEGRLWDDKRIAKGDLLIVQWGYPDNMSPPRRCLIQSVKGGAKLKIEALGRGMTMHREPRLIVFDENTITKVRRKGGGWSRSEIAEHIAREHGYSDANLWIEDTQVRLPIISQAKKTDWQMLQALARRERYACYIDFDGFHFEPAQLNQKPIREVRWFTPPMQGEILEYEVENNILLRPGVIKATGIDPKTKKRFTVSASNPETQRDGLGGTVEVGRLFEPDTGRGYVLTDRIAASNEKDAKRRVDALFKAAQRVNVELKLKLIGDPSLVAKSVIRVTGISALIDGNYYVRSAKHKVDSSGFTMDLDCITDRGQGEKTKAKVKGDTGMANPSQLTARLVEPPTGRGRVVEGGSDPATQTSRVFVDSYGRGQR